MTKQALCKRAVETLDNGLVPVNFSATAGDVCFVVFNFFGHTPHELVARVNLQVKGLRLKIDWKAFATSAESFNVSGSASL